MTPQWAAWLASAADELRAEIAEIMAERPPSHTPVPLPAAPPAIVTNRISLSIAGTIAEILANARRPLGSAEILEMVREKRYATLSAVTVALAKYWWHHRVRGPNGRWRYTAPR